MKLEQLERDEDDQGEHEQDADCRDEDDVEVEQTADSQIDDNANTENNTDETNPSIDDDTKAETGAESIPSSMVVTPSKVNTEVVVTTSKDLEEEKAVEEVGAAREANTDNDVVVEAETNPNNNSDVDHEEGTPDDVSEKKMGPKAGILGEQLDQAEENVDDDDLTVNTSIDDALPTPTKEIDDKPKKPKNSAWQAMLLKEKASLAKQKRLKRKHGGLVEGEAEEEEEEGGIVGLEGM